MAIGVRPGTLASDRLCAIRLLAHHLNPAYDTERFDWLHMRNPAGPGRFWMAFDAATGETVGTAAAFPRLFSVGGREERGWVLGDFCVSDSYRSLGPAIKLQRTCLELATDSDTPFCYDFPSQAMMSVYQRLRIHPRGQMRRLVKLLRIEGKLVALIGLPGVSGSLGRALDRFLALARRSPVDPSVALELHADRCGEEFSQLAETENPSYGICLMRSAAYLNWRYRENPIARYEILTARRRGRLVAYAVFIHAADTAAVVDLFGSQERAVLDAVVRGVIAVARQRGCARLDVAILDSHPWVPMFRRLGFSPREARPFVLSASPHSRVAEAIQSPAGLFIMNGDRDS